MGPRFVKGLFSEFGGESSPHPGSLGLRAPHFSFPSSSQRDFPSSGWVPVCRKEKMLLLGSLFLWSLQRVFLREGEGRGEERRERREEKRREWEGRERREGNKRERREGKRKNGREEKKREGHLASKSACVLKSKPQA